MVHEATDRSRRLESFLVCDSVYDLSIHGFWLLMLTATASQKVGKLLAGHSNNTYESPLEVRIAMTETRGCGDSRLDMGWARTCVRVCVVCVVCGVRVCT